MAFKDLKKGSVVFALDKQSIEAKKGNVVEVSLPRMDMSNPINALAKMVVDVTINIDDKTATYVMPQDAMVVSPNDGSTVIAIDQSYIIQEIEAMNNSSKQVLESIDRHKEIVEKTSNLLLELNPQMKAKKETDDRIKTLENAIVSLQDGMSEILNKIKGA